MTPLPYVTLAVAVDREVVVRGAKDVKHHEGDEPIAFGSGWPAEGFGCAVGNVGVIYHVVGHPAPEGHQGQHYKERDKWRNHASILRLLQAVGAAEAGAADLPFGLAVKAAVALFGSL